jgi:serine/threonine-protein kinase
VRRFRTEIKLARKITHPNVCRIHDFGESDGLLYISMELVDGRDLKSIVREHGGLPATDAYDVSIQAATGLEAIHAQGVVHRDLKTSNLMRGRDGRVRILDFGVARPASAAGGSATVTALALGTPDYMSPEQALGRPVDPRTDVYALAVVVFELFTGELPFHGDTPLATMLKHLNEPPPLDGPAGHRIPPLLVPVLRRGMAKDPAGRFSGAAAMREALLGAQGASAESEQLTPIATPAPPGVTAVVSPSPGRRRFGWANGVLLLVGGAAALALAAFALRSPAASPGERVSPIPGPTLPTQGPSAVETHDSGAAASSLPKAGPTATPAPSPSPSSPAAPAPSIETVAPEDLDPLAALPVGTRLLATLGAEVRSDRARVGDSFGARLAEPLVWEGRQVAGAGTRLAGRVFAVSATGTAPFLELRLTEIEIEGQAVPMRTGILRLTARPPVKGGPSPLAVVVGAVAGAGIGAALDGREGAAGGTAAGAAAGAALSSRRAGEPELAYADRLMFKLVEPLTLPSGVTQPGRFR